MKKFVVGIATLGLVTTLALSAVAQVPPNKIIQPSCGIRDAVGNIFVQPSACGETPIQADSLADSVGLNTHFAEAGDWSTYGGQLQSDLISLGVRHIRDGWFSYGVGNVPGYASYYTALGAAGVKVDIVTWLNASGGVPIPGSTWTGEPAADILYINSVLGSAQEAYEAPNEQALYKDPNWLVSEPWFQNYLYTTVKGNASTKNLPVFGPSPIGGNYGQVGNLSAYMDYGNMHNYMSPFFPGTTGWGPSHPTICNGFTFDYGSIDFNLGCNSVVSGTGTFTPSTALAGFDYFTPASGSKPFMTTETGYGSDQTETPNQTLNVVDDVTQGKYLTRQFLLQYAAGVVRTYWYQLADETTAPPGFYTRFGLVDNTGSVFKPSFYALQGLISTLTDKGGSFTTTPLKYGFSAGAPSTLAHMLFQKRDGTYVLAVWNETSSWNPNAGVSNGSGQFYGEPIVVPAQSITVNLPYAPNGLSVKSFNDAGNFSTVTPTVSGNSVTLPVDDHVTFVSFH